MVKTLTGVVRESLNSQRQEGETSLLKELGSWLFIVLVALAAAIMMNSFIIVNAEVTSGSMQNGIMTNDRVIGLRTAYWLGEPQRGDIVFFRFPDNESQIFIKRVIGLPGDVVEIKEGVTYINGEVLEENYLAEPAKARNFGPYEVPEDSYFMMGDNRNCSNDSRYWTHTYVSKNKILGKAYWIYYPRFASLMHGDETP
ncbi:MAG: signal peptidase I [Lachnospiraceae bacterium]|nr:signal peptidase I [Lachnospiraceae bacterium]